MTEKSRQRLFGKQGSIMLWVYGAKELAETVLQSGGRHCRRARFCSRVSHVLNRLCCIAT
ncbi:hypothetical protein [Nitratireductor rhodophyticola]|uniref:hypothetical protein n=1 Tax=Nitratireductor rhodophyticola TaxID=2854036 RepID=UPI0021022AC7|nr:hypothetical protein [Nitratireductor rhodophyticola]